jgi:hypothetical protein
MDLRFRPKDRFCQIDFEVVKSHLIVHYGPIMDMNGIVIIEREGFIIEISDIGKLGFYKVNISDLLEVYKVKRRILKIFRRQIFRFSYPILPN